jgi:hypothetical protein
MKIELNLTKNEIDKLDREIGINDKTDENDVEFAIHTLIDIMDT